MIEVLIGLVSGIISGTGMGGGTVLILLLSVFLGVDQHIAQATNLIFFIPTSIAAIFISFKQKTIDFKLGLLIGGAGMIGAVGGAILASKVPSQNLKRYFGVFLAVIAIHEIFSLMKGYRKQKKKA